MRFHFVILASLLLGACGTSPVKVSDSVPAPTHSIRAPDFIAASEERTEAVVLVRDEGFQGSFVDALVAVDGKDLVVLDTGQSFRFFLAPGNYIFTVRSAKKPDGRAAESEVHILEQGNNNFRLRLGNDGPKIERSLLITD